MTPNNNLSVLPWYGSIERQNSRKWWVFGRVYPLYTPSGGVLPFQFQIPHSAAPAISSVKLYDGNNNALVRDITAELIAAGLSIKQFDDYDIVVYPEVGAAFSAVSNGRYYLIATVNGIEYFSEVFTVVNDISPYLKIEWWDEHDFIMDGAAIVYTEPTFKNVLYLESDIAKPEYPFEEEGETRDGYFFPLKQISEKRYRFSFWAPEYLLDALRFVRMSDYVRITKQGQTYEADSFLISPSWEEEGDLAAVDAEFDTATVAKKIPYISIPIVPPTPPTPPTPVYNLGVSPLSLTFAPNGQSLTIDIQSNIAWSLTLPAWITANVVNGTGNATVTLTAPANTSANRTGTIIVNGEQGLSANVSASQNVGVTPSLSVWPDGETYNANSHTLYYRITSNGRWSCVSSSVSWIRCTASGTGNTQYAEIAEVYMDANGTSGTRSGVLTFQMTDYPDVTVSVTLYQSPAQSTVTYGLVLGASSQQLPASGGNYTLAVYGVTYTNGTETSRQQLNASALTITQSGSNAISRNGLVFSAANLGTNRTTEQTAIFSIVWTANGASANFECSQEANTRTPVGDPVSTYSTPMPNPIIWGTSGTNLADKNGDSVNIVPAVNIQTITNYEYTSGATESETRMDYNSRGEITVGGAGLSVTGSSQSLYTVVYEANPDNVERWGVITLSYTPDGGTTQTWTRSIRQAAGSSPSPAPSQITVAYENQQGTTTTITSVGRFLYANYIGWRFSGITGMWYTGTTPQVGDNIYSDTALTVVVGTITAITT